MKLTRMHAKVVAVAVPIALVAGPAWAQGPAGSEFRVNTYTTNSQGFPSVAMDSLGNCVIA